MNKLSMIVGMVLVAALLTACNVTVQQPSNPQQNTISVVGNTQFKVAPDEATVMLRVETNGTTAKEAQDKNSEAMSAIQAALKSAGVAKNDMETTGYNLYPYTYWDYKQNRQIDAGYKVSHTLKVKTTELERVGEFIQLGVDAGATGVDSISFELSDAQTKDAKNEALRQAVQDARSKAEALAAGIEMRLGKVVSVSINEYNVYPMYRGGMETMAAKSDMGAPAPQILPGDVDVSANVQVVFEIA
jgi:uncharacterized protein YggE